jgi:hypothetical protein
MPITREMRPTPPACPRRRRVRIAEEAVDIWSYEIERGC